MGPDLINTPKLGRINNSNQTATEGRDNLNNAAQTPKIVECDSDLSRFLSLSRPPQRTLDIRRWKKFSAASLTHATPNFSRLDPHQSA